jgi:hypothetical protein
LYWLIKRTYTGKANFHGFKSSTFKGRAAYHIIAVLYQAMTPRGIATWEKKFAYFWEGTSYSDEDWTHFFKVMKKVIGELFEIYYESWHAENKRSKIEYDTFLERDTTLSEIYTKHRTRINRLFVMVNEIFDNVVLARQPAPIIEVTA